MTSRLTIILAAAGLLAAHLAPTAKGQCIYFQITDLGGGNSRWQLVGSDTTYTVGPYDTTGFYEEQFSLPRNAFAFDYSQSFTFTFDSPIGEISDLRSGQSVPLNQISYYPYPDHPGQLQLTGGWMDHSLGDQFQITDFSVSDIAIPFSDLTGTAGWQNIYYEAGAWHNDTAVSITSVPIPEPSSLVLLGFSFAGLLLRRKSGPTN